MEKTLRWPAVFNENNFGLPCTNCLVHAINQKNKFFGDAKLTYIVLLSYPY